ncbi:uncharacterized protein J3R85_000573 [Psidium guajava]|nr:uncharacterized protein J3R85_000573 [Psidium guajava]
MAVSTSSLACANSQVHRVVVVSPLRLGPRLESSERGNESRDGESEVEEEEEEDWGVGGGLVKLRMMWRHFCNLAKLMGTETRPSNF